MAKSALLEKMRTEIRRRNYSYRTEQAYTGWVVRYVKFHQTTHPKNMSEKQVVKFLNYLANERNVVACLFRFVAISRFTFHNCYLKTVRPPADQ